MHVKVAKIEVKGFEKRVYEFYYRPNAPLGEVFDALKEMQRNWIGRSLGCSLQFEVENGAPKEKVSSMRVPKKVKLMDLPGRLSHEYFPKLDNTGKYMVWCATQKGRLGCLRKHHGRTKYNGR